MPQILEHIDAIARKLKRSVLFICFDEHIEGGDFSDWLDFDYEDSAIRNTVIEWLDSQKIGWRPCGHFANVNAMAGYRGQIYVDVPYDESLPEYKVLEAYLENPDGTMRFPEVGFYYCPLEMAMINAAHDEPGFWDRWAENF